MKAPIFVLRTQSPTTPLRRIMETESYAFARSSALRRLASKPADPDLQTTFAQVKHGRKVVFEGTRVTRRDGSVKVTVEKEVLP